MRDEGFQYSETPVYIRLSERFGRLYSKTFFFDPVQNMSNGSHYEVNLMASILTCNDLHQVGAKVLQNPYYKQLEFSILARTSW